jgi:transposase-like protein
MGMVGVDKIGEIRRAYFEQERSIKEIVRTLSVSRATVRKVIRGHQTEFKYARDVQPTPKLGVWVETLTEILETESKLPKRERRSTQRLFEELRGRGYDGAHDSVHRFHKAWRDERDANARPEHNTDETEPVDIRVDWILSVHALRGRGSAPDQRSA